jgi:hypothetical protein
MSEEQSLRMKWRSREAAEELVREFEASGMRRKKLCALSFTLAGEHKQSVTR